MKTCSINLLKKEINKLIQEHKSDLLNGNTGGFLRVVHEQFKGNTLALNIIKQVLGKEGITSIDINRIIKSDRRQMLIPALKSYSIETPEDSLTLFKTNHKMISKVKRDFNMKAFQYCILDNRVNAVHPVVQTNDTLQDNICKFKNELIQSILLSLSTFDNSILDLLKEYSIDNILDLQVFSKTGNYTDLYYDVMSHIADFLSTRGVTPELVSSIDVSKIENQTLVSVLSNLIQLSNFDSLLDEYLEGIVVPNKKHHGEVSRTEYKLIYAADGSQQDIMGVADQEYENALNFVSPQTTKVISIIPKVSLLLNKKESTGKNGKMFYAKDGDTLSIPDLFQATTWLSLNLPTLQKYLKNIDTVDWLNNPISVLENVVRAIKDYISLDYSKPKNANLDSLETLRRSPKAHETMKALIKSGGNNIITLLSLYEFLFNDSDRIDQFTRPVTKINESVRYKIQFDIIGDIARQMVSTVAPAFIEYTMDGTIWDKDAATVPTRTNYIQKALTSKIGFSLRSDIRRFALHEIQSPDTISEAASILDTKKTSFAALLQKKEYLATIGKIFGITEPNKLEVLKDLLKSANDELNGKLFTIFSDLGKEINDFKAKVSEYKSPFDLYNSVNSAVRNIVGNINFDIFERVLAPLLGASPTPTFVDMQGHQLGVYRTTSLVFMIERMKSKYKQDTAYATTDVKPLRERSNIFIHLPELTQKADNSQYLSSVAIPLSMETSDGPMEARVLPPFVQDLHAFAGEYASLRSTKSNVGREPMAALQLGAYSDKGTLPQLVVNLKPQSGISLSSTSSRKATFEDLLFGKPVDQAKLFYLFQSTQKLDLGNNILDSWAHIFKYLLDNINDLPSYWPQQAKDELVEWVYTNQKSIQDFVDFWDTGIREELLTDTLWEQAYERIRYSDLTHSTSADNASKQYVDKVQRLKEYLLFGFDQVDELLSTISKNSTIPFFGFNYAAFQLTTKQGIKTELVQKLHWDVYGKTLGINQMLKNDIARDCTLQEVIPSASFIYDENTQTVELGEHSKEPSYPDRMLMSALNRKYFINGNYRTYISYLIDYFNSRSSLFRDGMKFDVYDSNGVVNPNKLIKEFYIFLQGTNFLRHQMLDLGVKEPYLDGKSKDDVQAEVKDRTMGAAKRNNTHTAPIKQYTLGMPGGVRRKTKLAIIQDVKGGVFNSIGTDREVDEWDGLGVVSPLQSRMESVSLGHSHNVSVKKTFITPVHDFYSEELKWASNEMTNALIKNSQGSEVQLESVFKRMHNIPFDWDITQWWNQENNGVIDIFTTLNYSNLYTRDGDKYYRLDKIQSLGNSQYIISRTPVSADGKKIDQTEAIPVTINSIYDLYKALNGINCCEYKNNKMVDSEAIFDLIYQITIYAGKIISPVSGGLVTQDNLYQPVADSFIGIFSTNSADKRGAANINPKEAWYDPNYELYFTEIDLSTGGEQLNAEHEANKSKITRGTQLLQDLAQKGYTSELVTDVYESIARAMKISSDEFNELQQMLEAYDPTKDKENKLYFLISEKIIKSLSTDGTNLELQTLVGALKAESDALRQPAGLPLSLIVNDVIKSIAPELNHVIKQKDSGMMGVLNGASGFVQVYNIGGQIGTFNSLTTQSQYAKYKKHEQLIAEISKRYNISKDEVIKIFSIVDLNWGEGQIDSFFAGQVGGEVSAFDLLLLSTDTYVNVAIQTAVENNLEKFGVLERKNVTALQPGDWFYDYDVETGQWKLTRFDSVAQIVKLLTRTDYVYVNKNKPVDLQPQIRELRDEEGNVENEYTCFESRFSHIVNNPDEDPLLISSLQGYLSQFLIPGEELDSLQQIAESLVNFKNHVKSFGFTLKSHPDPIFINGVKTGYDWNSYYGGFDPRKNFEQQLQDRIVRSTDIGTLIPGIKHYIALPTTTESKKQILGSALENTGQLTSLIQKHPQFFFRFIPEVKQKLYNDYMLSSSTFKSFEYTHSHASHIMMPQVFKDQIQISGKNITDVTPEDFKHAAPAYYDCRVDVDFVVRCFNGQYNIVVADDLDDKYLDKYGDTLEQSDIITDDKGQRLTRHKGSVIYQLPKNSKYKIKRDIVTGVETIILLKPKKSEDMWEDIMNLLHSDKALVSVEPFLYNVFNVKGQYTSVQKYLPRIQALNTLPSFNGIYEGIIAFLAKHSSAQAKEISPQLHKLIVSDHHTVKEDYTSKYAESLYHSFLRSLDVIATRIPTQNMSSIMTMRAVSLLDSDVNNVFVTKWQQWLQGADYDIDKAFLLCYNFDSNGRFIRWSPLQKIYTSQVFDVSLRLPLPTTQEIRIDTQSSDPKLEVFVKDWISLQTQDVFNTDLGNALASRYNIKLSGQIESDLDALEIAILAEILNITQRTNTLYLSEGYNKTQVDRLVERLNGHNLFKVTPEGINNRVTSCMHEILNDFRNATTAYKSIDVATDAFKNPLGEYTWDTYEVNLDNGHTISDLTASAAVGKDGVGIGANGTKGQFTLLNYFNRVFSQDPPLSEEDLISANHFNLRPLVLTYVDKNTQEQGVFSKWVGPVSDTQLTDQQKELYNEILKTLGVEQKLYLYDKDASQDVGALLSLSVDNAKGLDLDKLRASTDFFAMHIYLAMQGVPPRVIINYFNSPEFDSIISSSKNDIVNGYKNDVNEETFAGHPELLNIYQGAKELTAFAQILSINQGIKVEREDIISQKLKCEQLWKTSVYAYKDSIQDNGLFVVGGLSPIDTQIREEANRALEKAGITLKTSFDFTLFLNNPDYQNAIVKSYKVMMRAYNIFDTILQAPHFLEMLRCYNDILRASAISTGILDFTMNIGPKLYDKDSLGENKVAFGENVIDIVKSLPRELRANMIKDLEYCYNQKLASIFFRSVVSEYEFKYEWNDTTKRCSFLSDNSLHSFVEFVNGVLIPALMAEDVDGKNQFLSGLEINDLENSKNGNQFFGFNENIRKLARKDSIVGSRLQGIQEGFDAIAGKDVTELLGGKIQFKTPGKTLTVGDILFLYDMITKHVNSNQHSISPLFITLNKRGTLKFEFAKFVGEVDRTRQDIGITTEEVMAAILRYKVPNTQEDKSSGRRKELHFKDFRSNVLYSYEDASGKKYTRYYISMPLYDESALQAIKLDDKLRNLLLTKQLKVTVDINCN